MSWVSDRIRDTKRNENAYRASREIRSQSWNRFDRITTLLPAALAMLFLLLVLLWIVLFITS